ncbi:hypothetical protein O6H91_08G052400 [Diphasiastrum complanatum]|uniref:Uncharacterized protein n=1 Tax=Diphasiastrum complanatum TaxID=34168 RepID=A0ACC2CYH4_DIPCM|nr:hypothetical protein O6H91_08G052400 [Diphasiastrum complanatum]
MLTVVCSLLQKVSFSLSVCELLVMARDNCKQHNMLLSDDDDDYNPPDLAPAALGDNANALRIHALLLSHSGGVMVLLFSGSINFLLQSYSPSAVVKLQVIMPVWVLHALP